MLYLTPTTAPVTARKFGTVNQSGLTSFSAKILARSEAWSDKARALKFEVDFKLVEQERQRVAKEIHDEVLPHLSRMVRTLQASEDQQAMQPIMVAVYELNETLRDLLAELHPVDLEELGLNSAVQNLCQRYARHFSTPIHCREENEGCCLSELQQLAIYRALQLVLQYFAEGGATDQSLLVRYRCTDKITRIGLGFESKKYSIEKMFLQSMPEQELEAFFAWCGLAGAQLQFAPWSKKQPTNFLVLSALDSKLAKHGEFDQIDNLSQIRLTELEKIMATAQSEWSELLEQNANLSEPITIALERKRLLAEIERVVSPGFTKVKFLAQSHNNSSVRRQALAEIAVAENLVNKVVREDYPRQLDRLDLVSMVKLLVGKFSRATLIKPKLIAGVTGTTVNLEVHKKLAIYKIVQEALNNIEKHAEAKNVLLLIEPENDGLIICIEDDGIGLSHKQNTSHRGLKNIRARAEAIAASVTWHDSISYPSGTLLTIKLNY